MINFDLQKRKFESYFGTRKYKLSFWGISPQLDWYVMVGYFLLGVLLVMIYGFADYRSVSNQINGQVEFVQVEVLDFDYKQVREKVDALYLGGRGNLFVGVERKVFEEENSVATSTDVVQ